MLVLESSAKEKEMEGRERHVEMYGRELMEIQGSKEGGKKSSEEIARRDSGSWTRCPL